MQTAIHPKWHEAKVSCACGNTFTLGATVPEITVEVCANCHPYYTGQMKFVDTAGRVDHFRTRAKAAKKKVLSKADRRAAKRAKKIRELMDRPESLDELRKTLKKTKKSS
jgi:large subunit ribosomal protein L31